MNTLQIANFVYWINETHNLRGLKDFDGTPREKLIYISKLQTEFLGKYPDGYLTGWSKNDPNEQLVLELLI
jgi:hypothetical protein